MSFSLEFFSQKNLRTICIESKEKTTAKIRESIKKL